MLPAALQEWLPPDHLAYFISDVVEQLDLSAITARYEEERRGGPPYHPRMMVKVLLYGYCTGVASSRRIAQRLHEDIAFRVLAANNTPDFRTVSDFRKDHLEALGALFLQVLALCQRAGLVKLGHVALDGTKVRANASRNKAMSYGRMSAVEGRGRRLAAKVDDDEDRRYGKGKRGDELPEELAFRESRLRKIREAKAALEAEALAEAEQAESEGRNHPGVPADKAQRNFTDPDSRIMPGPGGRDFQQSYNCQAVVDSGHQVIVAARATPALGQAAGGGHGGGGHRQCGDSPQGGFTTRPRRWMSRWTRSSPRRRPAMAGRRHRRPGAAYIAAQAAYETGPGALRSLETVTGVRPIKQGRGFRQFLLRGLAKVNREWLLICTGHNLLKLFRFGEGKPGKARATGPAGNNRDWHGIATRGIFRLMPAYTCPPRTRLVTVGWPQLNPCQSAIPDDIIRSKG